VNAVRAVVTWITSVPIKLSDRSGCSVIGKLCAIKLQLHGIKADALLAASLLTLRP
jgi:hypothetical protein